MDAHHRFTTVDVGSMRRFSDRNIFSNSNLGEQLNSGSIAVPNPKPLPGQQDATPDVFIGDEAFELSLTLRKKLRVTLKIRSMIKVFTRTSNC